MILGILHLDRKSRAIIEYILPRQHASLQELMLASGYTNHMETLNSIKKKINPAARRSLGRDLLKLKRLAMDPVSGDPVVFHWWLEESLEVEAGLVETKDTVIVCLTSREPFSGKVDARVGEKKAVIRVFKRS